MLGDFDGWRRGLRGYVWGARGLALAVLVLGSSCQPEAESCVVEDECWGTDELKQLGRCAPKDVWCHQGKCGGRCAQFCEVIDPAVNPCDPSMICTERKPPTTELGICTDHPIACTIAEDCPLYIPPTETSGAWACIESVCRYPEYAYTYQ